MLQWEGDIYSATAMMQFVHLIVRIDWSHPGCFAAVVELIYGKRLSYQDGFPTLDAARAWCEAEYKILLAAEIMRLEMAG